MTLEFLLGTGNRDHQESFIKEAQKWLQLDPENEVFFLVPNFNKFELEKEILASLRNLKGERSFSTTRSQVFSFRRLAWFFLQKSPQFTQSSLSDAGAAMIFRKILLENRSELTVFQGEINKSGFIQQLYDLYKELQEGNISSQDLLSAVHSMQNQDRDSQLKLVDLTLIFMKFEEELALKGLKSANYLEELNQFLPQRSLKHILFIVTGFTRFSAREFQLLLTLMRKGRLMVSLLLDKAYPSQEPNPLDLFYDSGKSYFKLLQMAKAEQIPITVDQRAKEKSEAENLVSLRLLWEKSQNQQLVSPVSLKKTEQLNILKAENPKEEIAWIARKIRQKVCQGELRYQNIQLLVRDQSIYHSLIATIFDQHDIPYYLDEESSMEQHPLVEFLNALFAIKNYHYRLSDIMRLLRTELFLPIDRDKDWQKNRNNFRNKIDITENIALAYNFQGHFWYQDQEWQIIQYDFEKEELKDTTDIQQIANEVRLFFRHHVASFIEKINQVKNGREAAQLLYEFIKSCGVEEQLLAWRNQEIERSRLEVARNHEQTWEALITLLDEYVTIYGDSDFDWNIFQDILKTGLENLTYRMVPTTLDQVRVNRLELARPQQAQVTFAIGLNDQVFPRKIEHNGLLSSEDKELLNQRFEEDKYLFDETTHGINQEPFYAYQVFLSAKKELYLTYAANYDTQKDLKISPYLSRIHDYLGIEIQFVSSLTLDTAIAQRIGTYRTLLGDMNLIYRLSEDNHRKISKKWLYLKTLLKASKWGDIAKQVLESLSHLNVPTSLDEELVTSLYGNQLYASVSRLESFYNCEYKYFATYGLRLKERQVYGLTPAATGEFYHDALDRFFKVLISENLSLVQLNVEERQQLTEAVLKEVFGELRFEILNSSARMNYIRYQLGKTIDKVSWALQEQSRRTGMTPSQTEVLFGQLAAQKGIPGLELPLNKGGKLHVRGKIDRVDIAKTDDQTWLSVIDYKSSARSFDVTEAYYGLAMQLLTYLDVALSDAARLTGTQDVRPAGAYYLQVQNPVLKKAANIETETLKKFSYDGLFIDDAKVFQTLDPSLEAKENSLLFPIRKDAKNHYQKLGISKNKFYTEDELQLLRQHNRQNMRAAGNQILSGEIALNPAYKDKQRIACQYCPFRSVCEFDVMLKENQYHRLDKLSKEKVLERIRERGATENE